MKNIILLIALLFSINNVLADKLRAQLNPKEPVMNTSFELVITIESSSSEEPYISFDARGANVLGRRNTGVSTSTTFINGRLSTKRELTYVYELEAERSGSLRISNIKVDIGGKVLRAHDIRTNILRESRKPKNVFVMAVPSKTEVYLGEGIDVIYYLYRRVGVGNRIVESYPKLEKFIKRFHMLKTNREEAVEFQGMAFRRQPVYSARLYPEKLGKAYIDPLKMKVDYAVNRSGGGMFGFGLRQMRTKSLRSKKIQIKVLPIPTEGMPTNFTGLVGEHEFRVQTSGNKHLVNEAIEIKLVVEGEGALENYEAPVLYEHQNLEKFDTKSELSEMGTSRARKVLDYTYLARGPLQIPGRELRFSIFDPESESFVEKAVPLPSLIVGGSAPIAQTGSNNQNTQTQDPQEKAEAQKIQKVRGLLAPIFYPIKPWQVGYRNWIKYLNILLCIFIILFSFNLVFGIFKNGGRKDHISRLCDEMRIDGINYSRLHKLLNFMAEGELQNETSLSKIIDKSQLPEDTKKYFSQLINESEEITFKRPDQALDLKYKNKHFDNAIAYIRSQNGNYTELKRT